MIDSESTDITLEEALLTVFQENDKCKEDVNFILVGGLGLDVDGFWKSAAECVWDIGKLNDEFGIVFKDRTWLGKHYSRDGNVRLKYYKCPNKPVCVLLNSLPQEFLD